MKKVAEKMVEDIEADILSLQKKVFEYGDGKFTCKEDDVLIGKFDVLIIKLDELKQKVRKPT